MSRLRAGTAPLLALLLLSTVPACRTAPGGGAMGAEAAGSLLFPSRADAIPAIRRMLKSHDWKSLALYYDLTGSDIRRSELASGAFFYDPQREGPARYLHPFPPAAHLDHEMGAADPDVAVMVMVLDHGGNGPDAPRHAFRFKLKRNGWGWQILPDPVPPAEAAGTG